MTISERIAQELGVNARQVEAAVRLLDEGATVPFIARYRKEATGGLDDTQLRSLEERLVYLRELEERRDTVLKSIAEQDKLNPELEAAIRAADTKTRLEDLYAPYRPKRRTRAQIAREAGLEPVLDSLLADPGQQPEAVAAGYVNADAGFADAAAVLDGVRQIFLERAAEQADLVITSVSADDDLLGVIEQIAPVMTAGSIVLDTSTVSIETARQVDTRLQAHGIHFLDSPVSGGKEGAEKATMVMMVGGDAAVLAQIEPILATISRKVVHMGPVGSGQATKAVNQIMCAGINQAVPEALAFGQHQGLDMDKAVDVVSSGAAGNWFVEHRGRSMTSGTFAPGFRVALHHKDLKICQAMMEADNVQLPMVEMTLVHYERLMADGHGDEDISALYRLKRPLFGEGV